MADITVRVPGQQEGESDYRDVTVEPGSRALDVLRAAGLPPDQFRLCKPDGGFYDVTDQVHPDVADRPGIKLEVVPGRMEAGLRAGAIPALPFLRRSNRPTPVRAGRPAPTQAGRSAFPYWQERKWRQAGPNHYVGNYRVNGRAWSGDIDMGQYPPMVKISSPPQEVRGHPHWSCFAMVPGEPGYFRIHLTRAPADIDDAIHGVENIIAESLTGRIVR